MKKWILICFLLMAVMPILAQTIHVTKSAVFMRRGPDKDRKVILTVPEGAVVKVTDTTNEWWWRVEYDGREGYVSVDFIRVAYLRSAWAWLQAYPWMGAAAGGLVLFLWLFRGRGGSGGSKGAKAKKKPAAKSKPKKK